VSAGFFSTEKERFMFLFERKDSNSFTRMCAGSGVKGGARFAKCVRYLCAIFFIAGFLVVGCKQEPDEDPKIELDSNLIGTWTSTYSDKYIITDTHLTYDDGYGGGYAGTIRYAAAFSGTAGVIIFEYDADKKPTYYDSFDNYGDPDHIVPLKGNFIGVYYKGLQSGVSVQIGIAYAEGGAEEPTLDAAKNAFTMGKEGDYIGSYGTYTK
jgi:hypothetical protein